tara:strand:+ start:1993 stop:2640 length:648 start_codon:yes stop_codon:yes gene_type:complete
MPRSLVHSVLEDTDIELASESRADYTAVEFSDTESTLTQLAATYIELINEEIENKDVASSGFMQDNIKPTDLEVNGGTLSVGITAPLYASYVDEGVNGWAVNRGSRFNYKRGAGKRKKGGSSFAESPMVKSLKEYINREGESARNIKVSVTDREEKGRSMRDATTKAAMSMAFMIKRQGIKPRHFWRDATNKFLPIAEKELGTAVKIDIINNLVP